MPLAALAGFLDELPLVATLGTALLCALVLGFVGAPLTAWTALAAVLLFGFGAPTWLLVAFVIAALVMLVPVVRTAVVSAPVMHLMRKLEFLPTISGTERTAIEAGTVWMDGELFSGFPDFERLMGQPMAKLSDDEQAFLDGPCEEVCRMTSDWEVTLRHDLPSEVWAFLRAHGFFGLIIPKAYGGKGFSQSAHSAVIAKLASRCMPLAITVMVPNSLGPAELLNHYGTQAQKDHYLPRLARGDEIPCFALTEPAAGSDAGSITSHGVVFRDKDGQIKISLNWRKRYITLAAVSTVLGLAFKLRDPENLLGKGTDPGITCALVPSKAQGVVLGRRHDPMGVPFFNCPTEGHDVVVGVDAIIGGEAGVGNGWRMLMECLAAGRGVSLPASSCGGARKSARVAGAYAAVRKQFGLPIGRFEGIHEPLARIAGNAYLLEAARRYTCGALDQGAKPAVVTAMAKWAFTEVARTTVNDAMDVVGGAGISRGPRNTLANTYIATPISITVEGANILTRTLMIFGQGAIRCHPFAYKEIVAAAAGDASAFDAAFWGHVGHVVRNGSRALLLSLTRGRLAGSPIDGPLVPYARKLAWTSASFAFLADVAMASLGGDLKRKETVTGRFADVFAWMYLATATLRRFEADGRPAAELPLARWSLETAFDRIQHAFDGIYANLPVPGLSWLLKGPVAFWSRTNRLGGAPSDDLVNDVATAIQQPGALRDALTAGTYLPPSDEPGLGRLEHAFTLCVAAEAPLKAIKNAVRAKVLPKDDPLRLVEQAVSHGVISAEDGQLVRQAEQARADVIEVDAYDLDSYLAPDSEPAPLGTLDVRSDSLVS
ncbi:MAG: acyl-CoA dehydrogenase [Planctomycetes bacterium]|nr:acyl-CoA dehydrogenase [Planctomycetota bacterium]